MFFKDVYKPIPNFYNLVLAMLWRHPENVDLEKVMVVHYCAAVSDCIYYNIGILKNNLKYIFGFFIRKLKIFG